MSRYRLSTAALIYLLLAPAGAAAQMPVPIFRSPQSANLPTATMIVGGSWQFEISHRFAPPVSRGADALWGLDGPVDNRIGLTWAPVNSAAFWVVRSNRDDNVELGAKTRLAGGDLGDGLWALGAAGGWAVNTDVAEVGGREDNEAQAYGMLMLNVKVGDDLALGVVPAVLHNVDIGTEDAETALSLGLHGQLYLPRRWSFLVEWNFSEQREDFAHDAGTFGFEWQAGGHFFKLLFTNSIRANMTQYLAGTPFPFEPDEWRFGFNITRLFRF